MDQMKRFIAAGWSAARIDGHNVKEISAAIAAAKASDRPSLIACRTTIGFGSPKKQGTEGAHGSPLGPDEVAATRKFLGWTAEPFVIPEPILSAWRAVPGRAQAKAAAWRARLAASPNRAAFEVAITGDLPPEVNVKLAAIRAELVAAAPSLASRKASEMALGVINAATDMTIGGSADLTHSNFTITKGQGRIAPSDYAGRYIHFGVREHGMAAAMNGIALHGGFVPYGGTFLVFSDFARGGMRLSALMGQRVVYVMTHDSIGLGEDGPTHQPVEHLAMLRATPNLLVMRPADAVETAECWEIALNTRDKPSVLCLSRQNLKTFRLRHEPELKSVRGGYVVSEPSGKRDVTLISTGSEVEIAAAAIELLKAEDIGAALVSMPCQELFDAQSQAYRSGVLGQAPRVAVEAASRFGWDRYLGTPGAFIGMEGFGASAPAGKLYDHFGITPAKIAAAARGLIRRA